MSKSWIHKDTDSEDPYEIFWNSLKFPHGFAYFLAYIELILKCALGFYLFSHYKGKYGWKDLLNIKYSLETSGKTSDAVEAGYKNENEIPAGFDDSFKNEY